MTLNMCHVEPTNELSPTVLIFKLQAGKLDTGEGDCVTSLKDAFVELKWVEERASM